MIWKIIIIVNLCITFFNMQHTYITDENVENMYYKLSEIAKEIRAIKKSRGRGDANDEALHDNNEG